MGPSTRSARQIERLGGIKLDIEGAELSALSGVRRALAHFRPWLVVAIGKETSAAASYEPGDTFDFFTAFDCANRGGKSARGTTNAYRKLHFVCCARAAFCHNPEAMAPVRSARRCGRPSRIDGAALIPFAVSLAERPTSAPPGLCPEFPGVDAARFG